MTSSGKDPTHQATDSVLYLSGGWHERPGHVYVASVVFVSTPYESLPVRRGDCGLRWLEGHGRSRKPCSVSMLESLDSWDSLHGRISPRERAKHGDLGGFKVKGCSAKFHACYVGILVKYTK